MKKTIILLLCCGVLISMAGCGGNTAASPIESPQTTVSETVITETPLVTAVEPTEKEKEPVPTERKGQKTKPTVIVTEPREETKLAVTSITEEKVTSTITETVPSTTSQLAEKETPETEPPKDELKAETKVSKSTEPEPTEKPTPFDIDHWITFAKEYAVSIGLKLDSSAVDCWDNPIRAGTHCIYLERDIQSRLNRYAKDEDITDVWIWAESACNVCYDIYIGYA